MSEPIDKWPPAPNTALTRQHEPTAIEPSGSSDKPVENCPSCGRKLLTVRSVLCNWCGARIEDEEYLKRAARERAAQDAAERERAEQEMQETARFGVLGRLKKVAKSGKKPTNEPPLLP